MSFKIGQKLGKGNVLWEENTENEYTMDLGENLIPHKIEKTLVEKGSRNLAGKRP